VPTFFPTVERWLEISLAAFGLNVLTALVVLAVGAGLAHVAGGAARAAVLRTPLQTRRLLVNFFARTARTVVLVISGVVALGALGRVLASDPRILAEPAPHVVVNAFGESGVELAARAWVAPRDFLQVSSDVRQALKEALERASIEIPFPHRVLIQSQAGTR